MPERLTAEARLMKAIYGTPAIERCGNCNHMAYRHDGKGGPLKSHCWEDGCLCRKFVPEREDE